MAYKNFIPTVWATAIERELNKKLVYGEDCNRKYEGNVKKMGDSVRILGVGKPTITTQEGGEIVLPGAEKVADTSVTMVINHVSYFDFLVDDIDARQAAGDVMDALNAESSEGLADEMDKHIASMMSSKLAPKLEAGPIQLTRENVLNYIDAGLTKLYENNVRPEGKIVMHLPPWLHMLVKQAYMGLDTNNSSMMRNGRVFQYGNVEMKMTNNVEQKEQVWYPDIRTERAQAFVNPMTHVEPYRPEKRFSDAVKGFVLYEAKIVRPKELIVLPCQLQG